MREILGCKMVGLANPLVLNGGPGTTGQGPEALGSNLELPTVTSFPVNLSVLTLYWGSASIQAHKPNLGPCAVLQQWAGAARMKNVPKELPIQEERQVEPKGLHQTGADQGHEGKETKHHESKKRRIDDDWPFRDHLKKDQALKAVSFLFKQKRRKRGSPHHEQQNERAGEAGAATQLGVADKKLGVTLCQPPSSFIHTGAQSSKCLRAKEENQEGCCFQRVVLENLGGPAGEDREQRQGLFTLFVPWTPQGNTSKCRYGLSICVPHTFIC